MDRLFQVWKNPKHRGWKTALADCGDVGTKWQMLINSSLSGTGMTFFLFNEKPGHLPLLGT